MTKNLLNDRRFLDQLDSAVGGKQKVKRSPSRATETGTGKKQRDKTRRVPKEY